MLISSKPLWTSFHVLVWGGLLVSILGWAYNNDYLDGQAVNNAIIRQKVLKIVS